MNESIKDRFLKEHALNDEQLEQVCGGSSGIPCPYWRKNFGEDFSCPTPEIKGTFTGLKACSTCQGDR